MEMDTIVYHLMFLKKTMGVNRIKKSYCCPDLYCLMKIILICYNDNNKLDM